VYDNSDKMESGHEIIRRSLLIFCRQLAKWYNKNNHIIQVHNVCQQRVITVIVFASELQTFSECYAAKLVDSDEIALCYNQSELIAAQNPTSYNYLCEYVLIFLANYINSIKYLSSVAYYLILFLRT